MEVHSEKGLNYENIIGSGGVGLELDSMKETEVGELDD